MRWWWQQRRAKIYKERKKVLRHRARVCVYVRMSKIYDVLFVYIEKSRTRASNVKFMHPMKVFCVLSPTHAYTCSSNLSRITLVYAQGRYMRARVCVCVCVCVCVIRARTWPCNVLLRTRQPAAHIIIREGSCEQACLYVYMHYIYVVYIYICILTSGCRRVDSLSRSPPPFLCFLSSSADERNSFIL